MVAAVIKETFHKIGLLMIRVVIYFLIGFILASFVCIEPNGQLVTVMIDEKDTLKGTNAKANSDVWQ